MILPVTGSFAVALSESQGHISALAPIGRLSCKNMITVQELKLWGRWITARFEVIRQPEVSI